MGLFPLRKYQRISEMNFPDIYLSEVLKRRGVRAFLFQIVYNVIFCGMFVCIQIGGALHERVPLRSLEILKGDEKVPLYNTFPDVWLGDL